MTAAVIWLTGVPASGKSTLARAAADAIRRLGRHVEVLDGDETRGAIAPDLGFSDHDRDEHVRRVSWAACLLARNGIYPLVALVSPRRDARWRARERAGRFLEVHVHCPADICAARDPKGLYRMARSGIVRGLPGFDAPYEAPENPEVRLDTSVQTVEQCVITILSGLDHLFGLSGVQG